MASSAAIAKLRMLTNAGVDPKVTDEELGLILDDHAYVDANGVAVAGSGWVETYDYTRSALAALRVKKSRALHLVNFNSDGSAMSMSDVVEHIESLISDYRRQLSGTGSHVQ